MARLLVIDNYDSFTYNLVQMFRSFALEIEVHRSDAVTIEQAAGISPDYILISPGPKAPANAGISKEIISAFYRDIPILGVCLGMQCINEVFGGQTMPAPVPMHGKTSRVVHGGRFIFEGVRSPFTAARYHSLTTSVPTDASAYPLIITARAEDGVVMGLSHPYYPLNGVQFHPESFLTEFGFALVDNFLGLGPLGRGSEPLPAHLCADGLMSGETLRDARA